MNFKRRPIQTAILVIALVLVTAQPGVAQRTELKPGFNVFSPEQDVEMGREVAMEAERELPIIDDVQLEGYLNRLGRSLASVAPGEDYPYQFKLVNDSSINAFALPGGFIFIHRGIIEAADREAELAGVMAHEIAHVAMRHGTNQASKAYIAQAPLAILGGIFGGGSGVGSILTQLGIGFGASSLFLKFSRDAERQADLMGAQILYDAGIDPTGMSEFFEKLGEEGGGGVEFFSSHPNPENRIDNVQDEIAKLGNPPARYRDNFSDFGRVKDRLADVPEAMPAERRPTATEDDRRTERRPEPPSGRYRRYESPALRLAYPNNWRVFEGRESVTFAPEGGLAGPDGSMVAYGMLVAVFEPRPDRRGRITLEDATDQLIDNLRRSNALRVERGYRRGQLAGRSALSTMLLGESPFGGPERDWLLTVLVPDGRLFYFVGVAPERDFDRYERTFQTMLRELRILPRR